MDYRTPSKYEPLDGSLKQVFLDLPGAVQSLAMASLGLVAELVVFAGHLGAPIRSVVARFYGRHMEAISEAFDPSFYLMQFSDDARRRRVARDPLLHYVMIGWRQDKAPSSTFDPFFARRIDPALSEQMDPLLGCLQDTSAVGRVCNENASSCRRTPWRRDATSVLVINHGRGGGSTQLLDLYETAIRAAGQNVVRLRAVHGAQTLAVADPQDGDRKPVVFDLSRELPSLVAYARQKAVARVLVNHVADRPPAILGWISELCARLGCRYDVFLHDYHALCPRIDLVDGYGRFCEVAPVATCGRCVAKHGSEVKGVDPAAWRRDFLAFLSGAERLFGPSNDLATRLQPHVPGRPITVWRPERQDVFSPQKIPQLTPDEPLRVIVVGALNVSKGAHVLCRLARAAAAANAPVSFTVIGPSTEAKRLRRSRVKVTGAYSTDALERLLREERPHVAFIPAIWPETWSFILTAALKHGLPIVAFDIGAPAERLRDLGRGYLLPIELSTRPSELLAAFLVLRDQWTA